MITEIAGFQLLFSDVSLGLVVNYLAMRPYLQQKEIKNTHCQQIIAV